ncbi:phage tail protein, partial [Lactiplantibacillus pentosus]|nr:phage tail protein [Lactiplantibacillus pentosus]
DGAYKSTYFDSAVGLQSSVESGAISYKYRSMIGSGQYLAYDSVINGQGFESQSGYTSAKDTTFSNPETITGYVNVTPASGIYLYGPTQKINFAGNADNIGSNGITMDAYGNIYAQANSSYWRIRDINSNDIVDFGIDTAGANNIFLHRELDIGNFQINTGHTFTSADNQAIHFAMGKGGAANIYAGAVNYTSLVKSSLLSVKKDVQKADTAYWAQLVNSIDLATYQYKTDDNTSHLRLSSIVDDVNVTKQWQLPDVFISRDENGKLNGVDDSVLLNATLATVQEQQKQIDQLNGHLLELEAKLNG